MYPKVTEKFNKALPPSQLKTNEPLKNHTTFKIGGPADLFFTAKTEQQLTKAIQLAIKSKLDYLILGWGSNILISDKGFRGLVIKNQTSSIKILGPAPPVKPSKTHQTTPDRHEHCDIKGKQYQQFDDLNYDESHLPAQLVQVSSGVPLPYFITWSHNHGLTGLQWFSRIPGTLGGAVINNLHGGSHFFQELLHQVTVLDSQGKTHTLTPDRLGLGYDSSIFQNHHWTVINATLRLYQGDVTKAKNVAKEWAQRKAHQPLPSAGCTFKNITHTQMEKLGYPTTGVGYIIEHVLKWSGKKIGGATISPQHHNFIINSGNATAHDVLSLIRQIKSAVHSLTGVTIEPEIFFVGFTNEELKGVLGPPLPESQ
jgi:UDP-N-acetylmuramate dehydrogenase